MQTPANEMQLERGDMCLTGRLEGDGMLQTDIKMTCCITGQSRRAAKDVWVQRGRVEIIIYLYDFLVKEGF